MNNTNSSPKLPLLLKRQLAAEPLVLLDVGCSGGISDIWNVFSPSIRAVGFDPLLAEVERLNREEKRPDFTYEAAFVVCKNYDELFPPELREDDKPFPPPLRENKIRARSNFSFWRTSAARAMKAMALNYTKEAYNQGVEVKRADRAIELDEFVAEKNAPYIDFIKIDTDGHDLEVLLGAGEILGKRNVLGVQVECQFHGAAHPYANVFSNIDRLMREAGFTLFDLDVWRYTRSEMPGAFIYDLTGQTAAGAVQWGEALYLRDLADPAYQRMTGYAATDAQLVKLACLFELYGLGDCAAELIVQHPKAFGPNPDDLLDILTPLRHPTRGCYRKFLQAFDTDPTRFFPSKLRAKSAS